MGHSRPRYNQKGRAAQRETRKRKQPGGEYDLDDSNALIIDEQERKKRRQEVRVESPCVSRVDASARRSVADGMQVPSSVQRRARVASSRSGSVGIASD